MAELAENEVVRGKVVALLPEGVEVELAEGVRGRLALSDVGLREGKPSVSVGEELEVLLEARDAAGAPVLSKFKADKLRMWNKVVAAADRKEPIEGTIVARIKGGYSVDIGVRAFLPEAQVDLRRVADPEAMLGETASFQIVEFDKRRMNIVLSRRALLEKEREAKKKETLTRLAEGAVLTGTVKNVTEFGAFVDLGGIDGLLQNADLGWGRGRASERLKVGDEVRVKVLKFDPQSEKISLGMKQLGDDPWTTAASRYTPGARAKGKVVSLTDYGAFIELEPGVEGLVHVTEMSWTRVKHPSKVMKVGAQVEVAVLEVDAPSRRVSLGMKQLEQNPWSQIEEQYPIGSVIRGQVRNVTDFGIFVGVQEGVDGLVHVSDLSWTERIKNPGERYKKGDEVEAVVLNIDAKNERMALGIKQLQADPWSVILERHPIGSTLKGKVTRVAPFGAFVEIEPGVEGLVHVSELRAERVDDPRAVVKEGEVLEVKVMDLDVEQRKVSLSVRALLQQDVGDYREYMEKGQKEGRASLGELFGDKLKGRS